MLLLNKSVAVLSPDRLGTQEAGQNQMRSLKEEWLGTWESREAGGLGCWRVTPVLMGRHPGNANSWIMYLREKFGPPVCGFVEPTHPDPKALWLVSWTDSISGARN